MGGVAGGHGGSFCADLFTNHVSGSCSENRCSEHPSVMRLASFYFPTKPPAPLAALSLAC